jgi:hypothetical protein
MQPIIITDNAYVTLRYLPDQKVVHHTIHQVVDEAVFKKALTAGVAALKQYRISKWLSDDRNNGPFTPEFSGWAINEWIPSAIANGWKYWANVVPTDLAAAGTLAPFMDALYEMGLRMMVFTNVEEALTWLGQMPD